MIPMAVDYTPWTLKPNQAWDREAVISLASLRADPKLSVVPRGWKDQLAMSEYWLEKYSKMREPPKFPTKLVSTLIPEASWSSHGSKPPTRRDFFSISRSFHEVRWKMDGFKWSCQRKWFKSLVRNGMLRMGKLLHTACAFQLLAPLGAALHPEVRDARMKCVPMLLHSPAARHPELVNMTCHIYPSHVVRNQLQIHTSVPYSWGQRWNLNASQLLHKYKYNSWSTIRIDYSWLV